MSNYITIEANPRFHQKTTKKKYTLEVLFHRQNVTRKLDPGTFQLFVLPGM